MCSSTAQRMTAPGARGRGIASGVARVMWVNVQGLSKVVQREECYGMQNSQYGCVFCEGAVNMLSWVRVVSLSRIVQGVAPGAERLGFLFPSLPSAGRRSLAHISPPVGVTLKSVVV